MHGNITTYSQSILSRSLCLAWTDRAVLCCLQAVSTLQQEVAAMDESECGDVIVLPLYASLPPDQQVQSFPPHCH